MTQEVAIPKAGGVRTVSGAISNQLRAFLQGASDWREAHREATPAIRAECQAVQAAVERVAGPVTQTEVRRLLAPLLLHFDPPSFGPGEAGDRLSEAWRTSYADALKDLPEEALRAAVDGWIRIGHVWPKVAHLRILAEPKAGELRSLAWRVRKVAETPPPRQAISAEERARVGEMMLEMRKQMAAGTFFKAMA